MGLLVFTYTHPTAGSKTTTLSHYGLQQPPSNAIYESDPGVGLERKWVGKSDGKRRTFVVEIRDDKYDELIPILEAWVDLRDYAGNVAIVQGDYSESWDNMSLESATLTRRDVLWQAIELTFVEVTGT